MTFLQRLFSGKRDAAVPPDREVLDRWVREGFDQHRNREFEAAQGLLPRGRDPNKRGKGNTLPGMEEEGFEFIGKGHNLARVIDTLEKEMREAAANLEFEEAARLRDEVKKLRDAEIGLAPLS